MYGQILWRPYHLGICQCKALATISQSALTAGGLPTTLEQGSPVLAVTVKQIDWWVCVFQEWIVSDSGVEAGLGWAGGGRGISQLQFPVFQFAMPPWLISDLGQINSCCLSEETHYRPKLPMWREVIGFALGGCIPVFGMIGPQICLICLTEATICLKLEISISNSKIS